MRRVLAAAALWAALAAPAAAHFADVATMEVDLVGATARLALDVPTGALADADRDRDGTVSAAEIAAGGPALARRIADAVGPLGDGAPGTVAVAGTPVPAAHMVKGRTLLGLTATWPAAPGHVTLRYALWPPGAPGARCVATVLAGERVEELVLTPARPEAAVGAPAGLPAYLALGVEHILTGYDHLLFMISLLMLGGGIGYLLSVVTAFTVAHSVTLSLAYFDVIGLPPALVESVIALSIAYVAAETFWRRSLRGRWAVTGLFGLIHGLGFAGALKAIALPPDAVVPALLLFNLGVEVGQLAVVGAAWLLLQWIAKQPWDLVFRRGVSALVVVVALYWFLERTGLAA